jgi:hypothetical protein
MGTVRLIGTVTAWILLPAATAWCQFGSQAPSSGVELGGPRVQRWRVGTIIEAKEGPCVGIFATIPVPTNWPEQDVKVVDETISDSIRQVQYRELDGGIRQMLVAVPRLEPGERAEALVTFEITRRAIVAPRDTSVYRLSKRPPRDVGKWLAGSPHIDVRHKQIRDQSRQITADLAGGWETVEAIHDWVKANIEHSNDPLKGSLATLRDKQGNHEDLTGLFIALCRAHRIPARTVWVPDYCYAEFYLEDEEGDGHWFPCELKEKTVFGTVGNQHMIIQKGDNIQVPEKSGTQRFVAEFVQGKGGRPSVSFVRQVLSAQ